MSMRSTESTRDKILWLTDADHVAQSVLILVPLWFGILLATHHNTFETSKSFFVMQQHMTEMQWAIFSLVVALISIMCWATNNRHAMIFQNAILMGWHGMVALCIFVANPITTGSGTYAILALGATLRAFNLSLSNSKNWY